MALWSFYDFSPSFFFGKSVFVTSLKPQQILFKLDGDIPLLDPYQLCSLGGAVVILWFFFPQKIKAGLLPHAYIFGAIRQVTMGCTYLNLLPMWKKVILFCVVFFLTMQHNCHISWAQDCHKPLVMGYLHQLQNFKFTGEMQNLGFFYTVKSLHILYNFTCHLLLLTWKMKR